MNYNEAIIISEANLLPIATELYGLDGYTMQLIPAHEGGRNVVYTCEREGEEALILRISFLTDRTREELLGEVEYVRYLFEHGGSVANVISSRKGNLLEQITHQNHTYTLCLFQKAKGKLLVENHYQYREDAPITEYYYNCGKELGKMHHLSKSYVPVHRRYSFFDKYNARTIDQLIPDSLSLLKRKMGELITALEGLDRDQQSYGLIHFDYNDGNYSIDFANGQITVYDFDNSCYGWYLYDLADLWTHGVGWIQFEPDAGKREQFMQEYFATALEGYRSETDISDAMLDLLPLFINSTVMENIYDAFEVMKHSGEEPECDEELRI